jgi:hypothetical protein
MTVMAHAGHWVANLLYAVPMVVLMLLALVGHLRRSPADGEPTR